MKHFILQYILVVFNTITMFTFISLCAFSRHVDWERDGDKVVRKIHAGSEWSTCEKWTRNWSTSNKRIVVGCIRSLWPTYYNNSHNVNTWDTFDFNLQSHTRIRWRWTYSMKCSLWFVRIVGLSYAVDSTASWTSLLCSHGKRSTRISYTIRQNAFMSSSNI